MKIVTCKNGLSPKKSFRRYLIVPLLSLAFLFTVVTHAVALNDTVACPSSKDGITTINKGTIKAITTDQSSLQVQCQNSQLITISVKKPELQAILRGFSVGDFVNLDYDTANELKSVSVVISFVNGPLRLVTLVVTGLLLYIITFLMVKVTGKNLNDIFVGQDKRLSNSKSQMAIWFFVFLVSYVSLNALRAINGGLGFVGGIDIPQNLLLLSGVSVLTYGGAKVITQTQVNSKPGSKPDASDNAGLKDFVTDDAGNTDFGDLQMSFITLLAVVVYLLQLFNFLGTLELHRLVTLPDVDTTILSIFGLSQGAYLTKKAAVATGANADLGVTDDRTTQSHPGVTTPTQTVDGAGAGSTEAEE
ncbi:hypothetical protein [Gloeothece verrucosa]|uniref:Uncharacterized protein n=1 Tax=Gloeothece verrucosa (strain PCC 7822) TaxID=497965 RepID=E0UM02_GLOV7|nr:hypothetical protein [Gloeothece verrucosa]ADN17982.1 hypothetical protein Cyan7822_6157 [Gloeothece verrucosa PCC 7822]